MVDQLPAFASVVTRVALEVGTQGILGGQAKVEGVQGTWADLTRSVNVRTFVHFLSFALTDGGISLTGNGLDLTDHVKSISEVRQTQQTSECGRSRGNA